MDYAVQARRARRWDGTGTNCLKPDQGAKTNRTGVKERERERERLATM